MKKKCISFKESVFYIESVVADLRTEQLGRTVRKHFIEFHTMTKTMNNCDTDKYARRGRKEKNEKMR